MGLFDRKRADITPAPPPAEPSPPRREPAPEPQVAREEPARPTPAASASTSAARPSGYGIQNAIELMRKLPSENVALVVEVVKKTLESLNVDIAAIIDDAERKQSRIDDRVGKLEEEISDYEEEIAARKEEIAALTADREETHTVRERLELALRGTARSRDTLPPQNRPSPVPPPGGSAFGGPSRPPLADRHELED
jgi:hypothetical protein